MEVYECKCGFRFGKHEVIPGQKVRCPDCGNMLHVPIDKKPTRSTDRKSKDRASGKESADSDESSTTTKSRSSRERVSDSGSDSRAAISRTMVNDLPVIETVRDRPQRGDAGGNLAAGQVLLDRYQISELVGRGGMSEVYAAKDKVRRERIALKVLLPELRSDPKATERFVREGRMASSFSHPHIARVFDLQQTPAFPFLTMELLQGTSLRQEFERRAKHRQTFSPKEALSLLRQLGSALTVVHQRAIHRDVKPDNIWATPNGKYKLMDFGIASELNQDAFVPTLNVSGSAYYMAPEQLHGRGPLTGQADQYAMGVVLYEALTGTLPQGASAAPHEIDQNIPKPLSQAVMKALSPAPELRHASMDAFLEAASSETSGATGSLNWFIGGTIAAAVLIAAAIVGYVELSKRPAGRAVAEATDGDEVEERYENHLIRIKGQTVNGIRTGKWQGFSPLGKPWVEGEFKNGEPHGVWTYKNAKGEVVGTREDGKKVGLWQETSTDEKILTTGEYKGGQRHGAWKFYLQEADPAELLLELDYEYGVLRKFTVWNTDRMAFVFDYDRVRHLAKCVSIQPGESRPVLDATHPAWTTLVSKGNFGKLGQVIHQFDWQPVAGPFDPELGDDDKIDKPDEPKSKPIAKSDGGSSGLLELIPKFDLPTQIQIDELLQDASQKLAKSSPPAAKTPDAPETPDSEPTPESAPKPKKPSKVKPTAKTRTPESIAREAELDQELQALKSERTRLKKESETPGEAGPNVEELIKEDEAKEAASLEAIEANERGIKSHEAQLPTLEEKLAKTESQLLKVLNGKGFNEYITDLATEMAVLDKAFKTGLLEIQKKGRTEYISLKDPDQNRKFKDHRSGLVKSKEDAERMEQVVRETPIQIRGRTEKLKKLKAELAANVKLRDSARAAKVEHQKAMSAKPEDKSAKNKEKLSELDQKIMAKEAELAETRKPPE